MKYSVILEYCADSHFTSDVGFLPEGTKELFLPFTNLVGIFHDVMEHYFEGVHPYFSGKGFSSLFGEMAASAHSLYYDNLGVLVRNGNIGRRLYIEDTFHAFIEEYDYYIRNNKQEDIYVEFPALKENCLIPYQSYKGLEDRFLVSDVIDQYLYKYNDLRPLAKKLVWKPGIQRAYIWGAKQAQKIIGKDHNHSYEVLYQFIEELKLIIKNLNSLYIYSKGDYLSLYGIKFTVSNTGRLKIKIRLLDKSKNEYKLNRLESYD